MNTDYFNRIVNTYGIGVDEFLDLFAAQGHKCPICQRGLVLFSTEKNEKPVVDHNHRTGAVRGILCHPCNLKVGWLEKNVGRTIRCVNYINGFRDSLGSMPPPQSVNWGSEQWKAWRKKYKSMVGPKTSSEKNRFTALFGILKAAATGKLNSRENHTYYEDTRDG
jgi:hypothetical protein